MRVDPEPTLKHPSPTLVSFGIELAVRQDEDMPTPYERPATAQEVLAAERRTTRRPFARPAESKVIAGVCAGLAQYFGWPLWLVRLAMVLVNFPTGAGVVGWQTTLVPQNAVYAKVGPTAIPWLTTAMLAVLGALLVWRGLRGGWQRETHGAFDAWGLGWMLAGLVLNVALIGTAGFIIASTALFACTAHAFGSRHLARDAGMLGRVLGLDESGHVCFPSLKRLWRDCQGA